MCKHWREYDDDGGTFEYCKLIRKPCSCCGTKSQCTFKWALEEEEREAVIRELISNRDYEEYLVEIIDEHAKAGKKLGTLYQVVGEYFKDRPNCYESWRDWFNEV